MASETIYFKREALYDQVWSRPIRDLAKEYGLSDVGLAKICRRLKVPLPGRGYWAQRQAGKALPKPPLPPRDDDSQVEVSVTKHKPHRLITQTLSEIEQIVGREALPENKVMVTPTLVRPHPLVAQSARLLRSTKPLDTGLIYPPTANGCLDVRVTSKNISRALRIMDALIKALEARGYSTSINAKNTGTTTVNLLGQSIEIRLDESLTRTTHELTPAEKITRDKYSWAYAPRYDYHPTGELVLRINAWSNGKRHNWSDGRKHRLEDCLNDFIAGLVQVAAIVKAREAEWEADRRQWAEAQRQRENEERLQREESERIKALVEEAAAWQRSRQIRDYVEAVRQTAIRRGGSLTAESSLEQWLTWALMQADRLDPLLTRIPGNHPTGINL